MRKSKLVLLFFLILSLALFTTGCETLMTDQTPDNGGTENGDVTNPNYFVFESSSGTITGYKLDGGTDVVIPSEIDRVDVEVIGEGAFEAMGYGLTSVEIPDTVTAIEPSAFKTNELASVDLGEGVQEIKNNAFHENYLTEIEIPDSVTFIGEGAFQDNGDLVSIEIGEGVNIEGDFTFADNFEEVYENHNKSAGVYKRDNVDSEWYKEE